MTTESLWWVERDDGEQVSKMFPTREEAQHLLDIDLFDQSEYRVRGVAQAGETR